MTTTWIHPLSGVMDRHGMLPDDWPCLRCGRKLNADGGHPAELYAGTWNGLCYPCTSAGPYVEGISTLDGCLKVSWPPHCPSWRRDREQRYGYRDCEVCKGSGVVPGTREMSYRSGDTCRPCFDRWTQHPLRIALHAERGRIRDHYEGVFQDLLTGLLGLPKRHSKKARTAAIEAAGQELISTIRSPVMEHYNRDIAELASAQRYLDSWRQPAGDEVNL